MEKSFDSLQQLHGVGIDACVRASVRVDVQMGRYEVVIEGIVDDENNDIY